MAEICRFYVNGDCGPLGRSATSDEGARPRDSFRCVIPGGDLSMADCGILTVASNSCLKSDQLTISIFDRNSLLIARDAMIE